MHLYCDAYFYNKKVTKHCIKKKITTTNKIGVKEGMIYETKLQKTRVGIKGIEEALTKKRDTSETDIKK